MSATSTLVLASHSRYRAAQLQTLGIAFEAHAHACDERAIAFAGDGAAYAQTLATMKAESLRATWLDAFILGCDQVATLGAKVLHKPETRERAIAQLSELQGKTHRLATAFTLLHPDGAKETKVDVHRLTMRPLSTEEIERYVDQDQPFDCCGSYRIESLGIALFEDIEGDDFTAIQGLPLRMLVDSLRQSGWKIP